MTGTAAKSYFFHFLKKIREEIECNVAPLIPIPQDVLTFVVL